MGFASTLSNASNRIGVESLEIRGEAENLFNKPHFNDPGFASSGGTTCQNIGGACGGTFSEITSTYGQRVVQIGAFVRF